MKKFLAVVVCLMAVLLSGVGMVFAVDTNHFDSITPRPIISNSATSVSSWVGVTTVTVINANYSRLPGSYIENISTSSIYCSVAISTPSAPTTAMIDKTLFTIPGAGQTATTGRSNIWFFGSKDIPEVYKGPVYIYAPYAITGGSQITDVELNP